MVYRSKVDLWLVAVVYGVTALSMLPCLTDGANLAIAAIFAAMIALETCVLFGIKYQITDNWLEVNCCGLGKERYDLRKITSVRASRSILSAPAASLDRIELRFGKQTVLVSPKRKSEFLAHLSQAAGKDIGGTVFTENSVR